MLSTEERLTLLVDTLKLAFSKPGFQSILTGLELDDIQGYKEMIWKADTEAICLLKLAGEANAEISETQTVAESIYKALD
jgi:hypothetical protein